MLDCEIDTPSLYFTIAIDSVDGIILAHPLLLYVCCACMK